MSRVTDIAGPGGILAGGMGPVRGVSRLDGVGLGRWSASVRSGAGLLLVEWVRCVR
ncbi:hypothetical protein [Amycolatopsis jejuensis]|uniref:hypothetical protein n=1 Tax=Amycolatopsis jejuensis TaxID=330084 RepID=UPI0012E090CC|nr:hypothetical protein [Amycolatopsis jejuensis]